MNNDIKNITKNFFLKFFPLILFLLISILFIITINEAETTLIRYVYIENLINYEGGFVRRGLLGSILLKLNSLISITPVQSIIGIYLIFYFLMIFFFYKITKNLWNNNFYFFLLVTLSPSTLFFPLFDFDALFRKEVFFFVVYFAHVFIAQKTILGDQSIEQYKNQNILIIFPLLTLNILIHEFQFFLIFFHFFINLIVFDNQIKKRFYLNYLFFILIFIFFIFPAGNETIDKINLSLEIFLPGISKEYTPITILTGNINLQLGQTLWFLKNSSLNHYLQLIYILMLTIFLYSSLFLLFLKKKILYNPYYKKIIIFFNLYLFSIMFFFIILSFDTGRLLHILLMHLIGFYLIFPSNNFKTFKTNFLNKNYFVIIMIIYFIFFYHPSGMILGGIGSIFKKMDNSFLTLF